MTADSHRCQTMIGFAPSVLDRRATLAGTDSPCDSRAGRAHILPTVTDISSDLR
jgi:hypothetical protein